MYVKEGYRPQGNASQYSQTSTQHTPYTPAIGQPFNYRQTFSRYYQERGIVGEWGKEMNTVMETDQRAPESVWGGERGGAEMMSVDKEGCVQRKMSDRVESGRREEEGKRKEQQEATYLERSTLSWLRGGERERRRGEQN